MRNSSSDKSFLRRTEKRASLEAAKRKSPLTLVEALPKFWSKSFLFEPNEEPEHINRFLLPKDSVPDSIEVVGQELSGERHLLATNVTDMAMAALLARARVRHMERAIELTGKTDDVIVVDTRGIESVFYLGIKQD